MPETAIRPRSDTKFHGVFFGLVARELKAGVSATLRLPLVPRPPFLLAFGLCALRALAATPHAQALGSISASTTSISGRVIDGTTGAPTSDAVVRIGGISVYESPDQILVIDALDQQLRESKRRTKVRTDPLGRFAFNDPPSGSYGIRVEMDGWSTGTYGVTHPGDPSRWLDLVGTACYGDPRALEPPVDRRHRRR
jgi:hypothetical protein